MNLEIAPTITSSMARKIITIMQNACQRCGFVIRRASGFYEACYDIGREYADEEHAVPRFILTKQPSQPWSGSIAKFSINNGESILEENVYYSHLTLLKMCKHFVFDSVLDIGSHERRISRIFEHLGKKVTTIEIAPGYEADFKEDYLKQSFPKKFDAIWCSQIYEHQRNPGVFLDKIFDDLKDEGILALTVPFQSDHHVMFGHINLTSPLMLIYHLVCAGFDCKNISLRCFNGSIGILLRKKYNGIKRHLSYGSLPFLTTTKETTQDLLGDEFFDRMTDSFPIELQEEVCSNYLSRRLTSINWGNPI